jgi:hypothetical protein
MVAVAALRWAALFALLSYALRTRESTGIVSAIFVGEILLGFLSYFSTFRFPLFVLALALPEGRLRLQRRHYLSGAAVAVVAISLAIVWTAIKSDYRAAISGGRNWQVVSLPVEEQFDILSDLIGELDVATLSDAGEQLAMRIGYTDYFGYTIAFVPRAEAHEDGRLWLDALGHVLMPRAFFPSKPALESDSDRVERYTGLQLSGDSGTSIALGAPAETYVDFGVPYMLIPALLFGAFAGFAYAWSIAGSSSLIDRGLAVALILPLATIENSPAKLLGSTLAGFLIAVLLRPILRRWLARESPATRAVTA